MNAKKIETQDIINAASYESKKIFFNTGKTKKYNFRIQQLKKLRHTIKLMEKEIIDALNKDLSKPDFEAYVSEVGLLYEEINFTIKRLKKWMKPKRVPSPIVHFPSVSKIHPEPVGIVLIIGPWNYPFQLLMTPVIGAIAAGNCTVLKPSNETPNTALIIEKVITNTFDKNYISVVQGSGSQTVPVLMDKYRFDHIFFTGSVPVGRSIGEAAAKKHTPVTLELGGKSPAIIDKKVNLKVAAKRLLWGKFFNAGQTCVSPDYLLIHESNKQNFLNMAGKILVDYFGETPLKSDHLAHIVNDKRMDVLISYLKQGKIVYGGTYDKTSKTFEPTIIDEIDLNSSIMTEEIFGPILPVISYKTNEEALEIINKNPYPLSAYIFTSDKNTENYFRDSFQFGGGCINNSIIHLNNPYLPFGGAGYSGTGHYHGEYSFKTFSHYKSIVKTGTFFDLPLKYAPYTKFASRFVRVFFE